MQCRSNAAEGRVRKMVLMLAQPLALALALALALMLALMPAPAETRVWPAPCQHYCRKPRDARGLAGPLARAYPNETRAPEYLRELGGRGPPHRRHPETCMCMHEKKSLLARRVVTTRSVVVSSLGTLRVHDR